MFAVKSYKKSTMAILVPLLSILLFMLLGVSSTAKAHEMWIQALSFSVKLGDKILANEMVGQNFKGNQYAYLDSSYKSLNISVGSRTSAVKSRLGDLPAIQEASLEGGLHIITAETIPSVLTYETPEKFAEFIKADGLEWVFAAHKKRGLAEKGFNEVYRRNSKALIKVGHGKGQDRAFGLPLEWVVETNPYTTQGNITAMLLWQGKPAVHMPVKVFNKPKHDSSDAVLLITRLRTDAEGRVEIPRGKGGLFLLNSVKMIEPDASTVRQTKAVWESIWGSLSYEILRKN